MKFKFIHKNEGTKTKSIKNQLTFMLVSFVVVCCVLLGAITSYLNYKSANNVLSKTIVETTKQASENISAKIKFIKNVAIQTGTMKEIADPKVSIERKQEIIDLQEKQYGLEIGQIMDAKGTNILDGRDYSDRDYVKISMTGQEHISIPIVSKVTGERILVVSAPVWENGVQGSKIIGVVTFDVPGDYFNNIVTDIKVSQDSYAYLVDKTGLTIAHKNKDLISKENVIEDVKADKELSKYIPLFEEIITGKGGYSNVEFHDQSWGLGYEHVPHTDGWSVVLMVNKADFLGQMYSAIIITIALGVILTLIATVVGVRFARKVGNPMKECSERLEKLANGDLHSEVPIVNEENEIGLVAEATDKIVSDMSEIIEELIYVLTEIGEGNLDINTKDEKLNELFKNDFEPMLVAIDKIVDNLNQTLHQINISSEQVAVGSEQVAEGAQVLSQGATEQASSVEELLATISEVSVQINETAKNAEKAKDISNKASVATVNGQNQMKEMIKAMEEISNTSNEIGNIIKNIDDIAFQTNILALNAAVEAARAGDAGKGFAVVADEVRNLAAKSAESAKNTEVLIESSIKAIENGTKIVYETAKSLDAVVEGSNQSSQVIQYIADASNEQAQAINQASIGVEQISIVVQTNSATAQESAAASEELSSQAQMLKDFIERFKIKDQSYDNFFNENL